LALGYFLVVQTCRRPSILGWGRRRRKALKTINEPTSSAITYQLYSNIIQYK
jgi:hypothetical protein